MSSYKSIWLGDLPVDMINKILKTELQPGKCLISSRAHKHIAIDHPDDYALVINHIQEAIANPTYIGQDPKYGRNFILVKRLRISPEKDLLVAVNLQRNGRGNYTIRSSYRVSKDKIEARRRSGTLHLCMQVKD